MGHPSRITKAAHRRRKLSVWALFALGPTIFACSVDKATPVTETPPVPLPPFARDLESRSRDPKHLERHFKWDEQHIATDVRAFYEEFVVKEGWTKILPAEESWSVDSWFQYQDESNQTVRQYLVHWASPSRQWSLRLAMRVYPTEGWSGAWVIVEEFGLLPEHVRVQDTEVTKPFPTANSRYFVGSKPDVRFEGKLVAIEGTVARVERGPTGQPLLQLTLAAPAQADIWVRSLVSPGASQLSVGSTFRVLGHLRRADDDPSFRKVSVDSHMIVGFCFVNPPTSAALFSPDGREQCEGWQAGLAPEDLGPPGAVNTFLNWKEFP